jgi:hypothetical protein
MNRMFLSLESLELKPRSSKADQQCNRQFIPCQGFTSPGHKNRLQTDQLLQLHNYLPFKHEIRSSGANLVRLVLQRHFDFTPMIDAAS